MARVTGIGGFFLRARDPEALLAFHARWFGTPTNGRPWAQKAGPNAFAPFAPDSTSFPTDRQVMVNLSAGWDRTGAYGRFARIQGPEGNPIELSESPVGA